MINNVIGRPISKTGVYVGYVLLVFSLVVIFKYTLPGAIVLLMSLVMTTLLEGIQIHPATRKFRSYFSFLFIKFGKWQELDRYSFLCVLRKNKAQTLGFGNSTAADIDIKFIQYEICLLNESHYDRLLVKTLDEKEEAARIVAEYSKVLNKPVVEFHPKSASKRRR